LPPGGGGDVDAGAGVGARCPGRALARIPDRAGAQRVTRGATFRATASTGKENAMKSRLTLSTIIAVCAVNTASPAQETAPKSIEELRREVRALEARLQALSAAASEIAELTTRSAAIWSRALGAGKDT